MLVDVLIVESRLGELVRQLVSLRARKLIAAGVDPGQVVAAAVELALATTRRRPAMVQETCAAIARRTAETMVAATEPEPEGAINP